jgi:hypothetical protein
MANSRRAIATKLLELQQKIAPDLLKIDGYKDQLRDIGAEEGAFTEEIDGLGSVEVKGGSEKKLKGLVPTLHNDAYMALSEARRATLAKEGIVTMEQDWAPARKPSVTVRL